MLFGRKDATQLNFIFALIFTFFFRKIVVYTNWWTHTVQTEVKAKGP